MTDKNNNLKYFLYARKSSEGEDRQVQSIPDQTNRLIKLAEDADLTIVEILSEAKSAKSPNNRPVFEKMLERIENGEADGILCWEINRLSRNPVDSGKIQWMLQQGIIKSVPYHQPRVQTRRQCTFVERRERVRQPVHH